MNAEEIKVIIASNAMKQIFVNSKTINVYVFQATMMMGLMNYANPVTILGYFLKKFN